MDADPALYRLVACLCVGCFAAGYIIGLAIGAACPKAPRIAQKPLGYWKRKFGLRYRT